MSKNQFLAAQAADRAVSLNVDAQIRNVAAAYRRGQLAAHDAIVTMRAIGACEPEIMEIVR